MGMQAGVSRRHRRPPPLIGGSSQESWLHAGPGDIQAGLSSGVNMQQQGESSAQTQPLAQSFPLGVCLISLLGNQKSKQGLRRKHPENVPAPVEHVLAGQAPTARFLSPVGHWDSCSRGGLYAYAVPFIWKDLQASTKFNSTRGLSHSTKKPVHKDGIKTCCELGSATQPLLSRGPPFPGGPCPA